VQIGVTFPQLEIGSDPGGIRAYAQAAEELGYTHLLAYDHVLGAEPSGWPGWSGAYNHQSSFHELFAVFGYIAGVAPRLSLVTGVIILPQRQTALVAKQATEIDLLTGGRFRLGVGIGWNYVEFEGLGKDFKNRARRFEEQIALIRELTTKPVLTFNGHYEQIRSAGINPLPVQRPLPIWIGAFADPALKRAAEIGDGFFPLGQSRDDGGWAATLTKMKGWREAAGKSWSTFGIDASIGAARGTPDDWRKKADDWRALGATYLSINTMGGSLGGPDGHIKRLKEVKAALGEG
jgi:probable F420-dependent oxidoreductase